METFIHKNEKKSAQKEQYLITLTYFLSHLLTHLKDNWFKAQKIMYCGFDNMYKSKTYDNSTENETGKWKYIVISFIYCTYMNNM